MRTSAGSDGSRTQPGLFRIIRRFKVYGGRDPYGYQARCVVNGIMNADRCSPALQVWLWQPGERADAQVVLLTDQTADALRPLTPIPSVVKGVRGLRKYGQRAATIPVHHVRLETLAMAPGGDDMV